MNKPQSNHSTHSGPSFYSVLLGLLAVLVGGAYVYFWRYGFNSDFAMIGLLAKKILTTGEQFIFVPKVGYQGLLYEANLVAVFFKLFGMSPTTLNFAPFFTYLLFCFFFYQAVRAWHGSVSARWATLFVILSNPLFYRFVLRTQPNYGETFLLGSILFWSYRKILDGLFETRKAVLRRARVETLRWGTFFGLVVGYGFYTYGQIAYFLEAMGLHVLLMICYEADFKWRKLTRIVLQIAGLNFFLGLVAFLFSWDQIPLGERHLIKFIPMGMLHFSVTLSVVAIVADAAYRHRRLLKSWLRLWCLAGIAACLGVSPKFYYLWVLKGETLGKLGISGTLSEVVKRVGILGFGLAKFLNYSPQSSFSALGWVAGIFLLVAFLGGYFRLLFSPALGLAKSRVREIAFNFSPFFFLFWAVIFTFVAANSVKDLNSIRYAVVLTLSLSVAYAVVLTRVLGKVDSPSWQKAGVSLSALMVLLTSAQALTHSLCDDESTHTFDRIVSYLHDQHIAYGFGDYWYSYVITFLTDEAIIVEPIETNYIPFYFDQTVRQKRIAYIDAHRYPGVFPAGYPASQTLIIYGSPYSIKSQATIDNVDVFTLEKKL
jgi:hypothetical protein